MTPSEIVARRVRMLRRQRGWSVRQLADECTRIGAATLTDNALENIERGREGGGRTGRPVTVDELVVFAAVFGTSPADLMGKPCDACYGAPPSGFTCNTCGQEAS